MNENAMQYNKTVIEFGFCGDVPNNQGNIPRDAGTGGGAGGAAAPVALYQEGQGGQRCPLIQFKGLPWRNSELSEMLVQIFYEFASENARNAVIELQE
jgi:hypothetical protein